MTRKSGFNNTLQMWPKEPQVLLTVIGMAYASIEEDRGRERLAKNEDPVVACATGYPDNFEPFSSGHGREIVEQHNGEDEEACDERVARERDMPGLHSTGPGPGVEPA